MRVLLSLWECFPRWDHKWQPCTLLLSWGEGLAMFLSCGHTVEHVALRLYWGPCTNKKWKICNKQYKYISTISSAPNLSLLFFNIGQTTYFLFFFRDAYQTGNGKLWKLFQNRGGQPNSNFHFPVFCLFGKRPLVKLNFIFHCPIISQWYK